MSTTSAIFRIQGKTLKVDFDCEHLKQFVGNQIRAVAIPFEKPINDHGKLYPFAVFAVRVTASLEVEPLGEGFPCNDREHVNEVLQVIQKKNQQVPDVNLISMPGSFHIGTSSNEEIHKPTLILYTLFEPRFENGCKCGFALHFYKYFLDKPRELVWEKLLPTMVSDEAEQLFQAERKRVNAEDTAASLQRAQALAAVKSEPSLITMQLKVLSKAYPETVKYLQNPDPANARDAYAAYQRETLVLTGHLDGTLDLQEYGKLAKSLQNAQRRKNPPINDVEFQLVAGWRLQGYDQMTPEQRYSHLKCLGFDAASPDAVRKICERLELPTVRKPGAPKKRTPGK